MKRDSQLSFGSSVFGALRDGDMGGDWSADGQRDTAAEPAPSGRQRTVLWDQLTALGVLDPRQTYTLAELDALEVAYQIYAAAGGAPEGLGSIAPADIGLFADLAQEMARAAARERARRKRMTTRERARAGAPFGELRVSPRSPLSRGQAGATRACRAGEASHWICYNQPRRSERYRNVIGFPHRSVRRSSLRGGSSPMICRFATEKAGWADGSTCSRVVRCRRHRTNGR
jgi:hypothetical protein